MAFRIILLFITLSCSTEAFKILVLFPTPSLSHQQAIMALTERLVQEGHELFVASPNIVPGLKNNNYTFVDLSFSYGKFISDEKKDGASQLQRQMSKWEAVLAFAPLVPMAGEQFLSEQFLQFQKRVMAGPIKFDLVITEGFFVPYTCAMTRLLTGNAPIISMTSFTYDYCSEDNIGGIPHLSYMPSSANAYTDKMSLWQKMENWFSEHYIKFIRRNRMEKAARTFFKETYNAEHLADACWTNVSLSFVASNSLYFYPRLLPPNVIELGPMHIKPPKKLPKNLQDWLDGAKDGVIYFSLGSNMKSKSLPEDIRSNFLKFFKERAIGPDRIAERHASQNQLVFTSPALPNFSSSYFLIILEPGGGYSRNMKKHSAISHDFTAQSLDKAVFWVEHVARHGGASHLRPSTADTTYFQYFCLDIISVILAFSLFILYLSYSICKYSVYIAFLKPKLKIN